MRTPTKEQTGKRTRFTKSKIILFLLILFSPLTAWTSGSANLSVPFIPEAPDNKMVGPWKNACEEASIAMVDQYYLGKKTTAKKKAKKLMSDYFAIENKVFGSDANTDAAETAKLINEYSPYFEASIIQNPGLDQIQDELSAGRPVIAFINGQILNNPRIPFLRGGSYYHTFVIKGFDEDTNEFITNDDGDYYKGLDLRYKYDTILGALRDYNYQTKKADGPPTVLFTSQRILAKTNSNRRIYLIKNNQKHHISSPQIFKNKNWKWSWVQTVSQNWLSQFPTSAPVTQ